MVLSLTVLMANFVWPVDAFVRFLGSWINEPETMLPFMMINSLSKRMNRKREREKKANERMFHVFNTNTT